MVLRVRSPGAEPLGAPVHHLGDLFPWPYRGSGARARCRHVDGDGFLKLATVVQGATVGEGIGGGGADEEDAEADAETQCY